jgi:hypothetical protein
MKIYPVHPIASCLPALAESEFNALKEHIRLNGLLNDIILFEEQILDGIHRQRACRELALVARYTRPVISDPYEYMIGQNLRRRHLTQSQLAAVAEALANLKHGGDRKQIKSSRGLLEISRDRAAELCKSNKNTMDKVRYAKAHGVEELVPAVKEGEVSARTAFDIAHLPKLEQPAAIQKAKDSNGKPKRRSISPDSDKAWEIEYLERINEVIPFPIDAPLPVDLRGELQTRHIQDAIFYLRKHEPAIAEMSNRRLNEEIFSYSKRIHFYNAEGYEIDSRLVAWNHQVNKKATARNMLLNGRSRRRERQQAEETERKNSRKKAKPINGFEGAWHHFHPKFKKLLSDFHLDDAREVKSAVAKFLDEYFEFRRRAREAKLGTNGNNAT